MLTIISYKIICLLFYEKGHSSSNHIRVVFIDFVSTKHSETCP